MKDSETTVQPLPEATGAFQYQELIESRLGQPIAVELNDAESQRLAASPGAKLAAARNALGLSVEQVSAQLKMAPRQINALEKDDYALLPEAAIIRGFIRAYAKLLKLDSAAIIDLFTDDFNKKKLAGDLGRGKNRHSIAQTSNTHSNAPSYTLALLLCLAAAAALAYFNLLH
ncbi:helix-turn-helix domain-containing protein [Undibacterium sp. CY18W]|uniref:Helix-turn-helix domain-containing protein n=1 Tax=Undibacterium hunanense TaxID=2762292 RepID=A0ABR6ZLW5_9BURK|nr:helix-turn-helix transcriptional regulator [Undibacterium hunanense]MBC3916877.1 helix-turn-helix domain-containing protein [Undibacterium hunanense]